MDDQAAVNWLRERVEQRLAKARAASPGPWFSWIEGRDGWGGDSFIGTEGAADLYVTVSGTHHPQWQADQDFIAANDPQQIIADCEADLALLDDYEACRARAAAEEAAYGDWVRGDDLGPRPQFAGPTPRLLPGLHRAVRHAARKYRHHDGYAEHWLNAAV
jgi:hypothetical protein